MKKLVLEVGGIIILTILILFLTFEVGAKNYTDLTNDQKQAYWACMNDTNKNCLDLLNKKDQNYRQCSISCFDKAKLITPKQAWCKDGDNGDNFFESGIVKTDIFPSGKEDSCYTFSNGKTYLFEGRCSNNRYQYLQKNCEELGKGYLCKEGKCEKVISPKIYVGPGNYTLHIGDKITNKNYEYTIKEISLSLDGEYFYTSGEMNILGNNLFIEHNKQLRTPPYFASGPYLTEFGSNFLLTNISLSNFENTSTFSVYDDCIPIYNYCNKLIKENNYQGIFCDAVCDYSTILPDRDYIIDKKVVISTPKGFNEVLNMTYQNALNCYNLITSLYGIESEYPLYLTYIKSNENDNGCSLGNYFSSVLCKVSNSYNGTNIVSLTKDLVILKEKIDKGICVGNFGTIFQRQDHEMTHRYLRWNIPAIRAFLDEGVATYTDEFVDIGNNNTLICQNDSYIYSNQPTKIFPYQHLNDFQYQTGACFLQDIDQKYGNNKFKEIFEKASKLKPGCYHLFKDIIDPVVGEQTFPIFKDKYLLVDDPEGCFDLEIDN